MSALCFLLLTGGALAADYTVDRDHSTLNFAVESALFDAQGTFSTWGVVATLPDTGELSALRGTISVDITSIDTRVKKRDEHLRSADFFDVAVYPGASFVITDAAHAGETLTVTGDLTIKGIKKTLTVPLTAHRISDDRLRLHGQFVIQRKAFGINFDSSVNPIGEDVTVIVDMNLMREGSAPIQVVP